MWEDTQPFLQAQERACVKPRREISYNKLTPINLLIVRAYIGNQMQER